MLLTVMVVVIDLSEKADDFAKTKLPVLALIVQYYFGFIPRIDAMLFPLFVFIAVIFYLYNGQPLRSNCHFEQWCELS